MFNKAAAFPLLLRRRPRTAFSPETLSPDFYSNPAIAGSLFQNSDGTIAATADTNPIGYWKDLSNNANHATQGTAGNKPILKTATINGKTGTINGKNSVQCDGDDVLNITSVALTGAFAVYFVASRANNTTLVPFGSGANAGMLVGLGDNTVYIVNDANALVSGVYTGLSTIIVGRFRRTAANVCYFKATGMAEINIGTLTGTITYNRVLARPAAGQFTQANNRFGPMLIFASDLPTSNPTGDADLINYLKAWSGVTF